MSVFAASVQGRNASLGTQLCQVRDRKGSSAGASAPPSCLVRNEETQHFAAQALKVHSLLVVILEKRSELLLSLRLRAAVCSVCLVVVRAQQVPSVKKLATFTSAGDLIIL